MNVELRIEALVLHGFPPGERQRIGEALERELARLFAEGDVPPSLVRGGDAERLDGGTFEVRQDSEAETIGIQVAQGVYGSLGR